MPVSTSTDVKLTQAQRDALAQKWDAAGLDSATYNTWFVFDNVSNAYYLVPEALLDSPSPKGALAVVGMLQLAFP